MTCTNVVFIYHFDKFSLARVEQHLGTLVIYEATTMYLSFTKDSISLDVALPSFIFFTKMSNPTAEVNSAFCKLEKKKHQAIRQNIILTGGHNQQTCYRPMQY